MALAHRRYESKGNLPRGAWDVPVTLKNCQHGRQNINGPAEAFGFMANGWSGERGSSYHLARRQCSAFLKRRTAPQAARDAFVAAASDAGLLQ